MEYDQAMDPRTTVTKAQATRELELHGATLKDYETDMGTMPKTVKTRDILNFLGY
jgi:hypothetical protein